VNKNEKNINQKMQVIQINAKYSYSIGKCDCKLGMHGIQMVNHKITMCFFFFEYPGLPGIKNRKNMPIGQNKTVVNQRFTFFLSRLGLVFNYFHFLFSGHFACLFKCSLLFGNARLVSLLIT
jgi:hypothetical protein